MQPEKNRATIPWLEKIKAYITVETYQQQQSLKNTVLVLLDYWFW